MNREAISTPATPSIAASISFKHGRSSDFTSYMVIASTIVYDIQIEAVLPIAHQNHFAKLIQNGGSSLELRLWSQNKIGGTEEVPRTFKKQKNEVTVFTYTGVRWSMKKATTNANFVLVCQITGARFKLCSRADQRNSMGPHRYFLKVFERSGGNGDNSDEENAEGQGESEYVEWLYTTPAFETQTKNPHTNEPNTALISTSGSRPPSTGPNEDDDDRNSNNKRSTATRASLNGVRRRKTVVDDSDEDYDDSDILDDDDEEYVHEDDDDEEDDFDDTKVKKRKVATPTMQSSGGAPGGRPRGRPRKNFAPESDDSAAVDEDNEEASEEHEDDEESDNENNQEARTLTKQSSMDSKDSNNTGTSGITAMVQDIMDTKRSTQIDQLISLARQLDTEKLAHLLSYTQMLINSSNNRLSQQQNGMDGHQQHQHRSGANQQQQQQQQHPQNDLKQQPQTHIQNQTLQAQQQRNFLASNGGNAINNNGQSSGYHPVPSATSLLQSCGSTHAGQSNNSQFIDNYIRVLLEPLYAQQQQHSQGAPSARNAISSNQQTQHHQQQRSRQHPLVDSYLETMHHPHDDHLINGQHHLHHHHRAPSAAVHRNSNGADFDICSLFLS